MVYVKQPRIKNNTFQQMKKVTSFKLIIIRKLSLQEWKFAHRVGFSVGGKIIKGLRLWMPGYLGILPHGTLLRHVVTKYLPVLKT